VVGDYLVEYVLDYLVADVDYEPFGDAVEGLARFHGEGVAEKQLQDVLFGHLMDVLEQEVEHVLAHLGFFLGL